MHDIIRCAALVHKTCHSLVVNIHCAVNGYNLINPVVNRRIKPTFLEETQSVCSEWESACHFGTSPAVSHTTTFVYNFPLHSCILLLPGLQTSH